MGKATTPEENKDIAIRLSTEVVIQKKNIDELMAPDFVYHGPGGAPPMNREECLGFWAGLMNAFPDLSITFEDITAGGDIVMMRYTTRATHTGDFMGVPATGVKTDVCGMLTRKIVDGKVAEEWNYTDTLHLMKQLGIIPSGK